MSEAPTYHAIAKLDANNQPMLGDAQVILHDGTVKVQFKQGRALVNAFEASLLAQRGDVEVVGFDAGQSVAAPDPTSVNLADLDPETRAAVREALGIEPVEQEAAKPATGDPAAIEAAQEYLADEGMPVEPQEVEKTDEPASDVPPFPVPEGWQHETSEGERRCQAKKADGSQCANAASHDWACGIVKHQEQLA